MYTIRDNRLDTGQTNTHLFLQALPAGRLAADVDVVNEHGNGDDGLVVSAWSVSVDRTGANGSFVSSRTARQLHAGSAVPIAAGVRFRLRRYLIKSASAPWESAQQKRA